MDAHPRAFGSFQVRATFGNGRFGPVFLADDPASGGQVVIRTFTQRFTAEQRDALLAALRDLCEQPLDHPSVARPIACGLEGNTPYFVHAFLDGIPADEFLAANGPSRLVDLVPLMTPAAAALDFAAAAGVTHGALGFRDVIIGESAAGISGFGLVQALQAAGADVGTFIPDAEGPGSANPDVRALATIMSRLLGPDDAARMRHLIQHPAATGLELVAALQSIVAAVAAADRQRAATVDDVPMRRDEPVAVTPPRREAARPADLDIRPSTIAPSFAATTNARVSLATDEPRRRSWIVPLAVAASLAIGLVGGFAAGVVVSRREAQPAAAAAAAPTPQPTATAGQIFTDQGVARQQPSPPRESAASAPTPVVEAPPRAPSPDARARTAAKPEQPQADARGAARPAARAQAAPAGPAVPPSLWVESRPTAATVYVDGQLVGRTPLLLGGIRPGPHTVRLNMSGYQQWTTRVSLADSGRTRVSASLEQQ